MTMNAGWKVFIGFAPMANGSWLTYLPVPNNISNHTGNSAFVLILWETETTSYEIAMGSYSEGHNKPFERALLNMPASAETSIDDRLKEWTAVHPSHELLEVGTTLRTMNEAADYLKTWRKNKLKYHVFWDNNSSFVDEFCTFMINGTVSWKINLVAPVSSKAPTPSTPGGIGQVVAAPYDTPLGYAVWRKNHASESYWGMLSHSERKPGRRDSTTSYSVAFNEDGRVNIEIQEDSNLKALEESEDILKGPLGKVKTDKFKEFMEDGGYTSVPAMSIVIMIVGSRGDVQPFIALGKELMKYGHRVRLATHGIFRQFVTENGMEFYPLAGDPSELMAYMVKNPGLLPSIESMRAGDIGKKRKMIEAILESTYKACVSADPEDPLQKPFVCHAIISNPPAFGHIHCAQRLFVPCHVFFTMPWSPTKAFPHPLVNVTYSKSSRPITNLFSYELVEFMTWEGLGDIINNFRKHSLGLPRIPTSVAPSMLKNLEVPHTYTWSEALIPKPKDWGDYIGFFFLDLASNYTPPQDLKDFLEAGPPPVYIGFGSIVVDDPDELTHTIFEAVKKAGVRALVSKGWGGLGGDKLEVPSDIYLIGNCPHDWLFQHVSAVVHHGGAGTTAAGLRAGKPTIIVPFFGDQPFWGAMVASIGAGPAPIHNKKLNAERLSSAISFALLPETVQKAKEASIQIMGENGVREGAKSFHRHLPLDAMRCDVDPSQIAISYVPSLNIKISRKVAEIAINAGRIRPDQLLPYRYKQWEPESAKASAYAFEKDDPEVPSTPKSPNLAAGNLLPAPQNAEAPAPSSLSNIRRSVSNSAMRLGTSLASLSEGARSITGKITSLTIGAAGTAANTTAYMAHTAAKTSTDTVQKASIAAQAAAKTSAESLTKVTTAATAAARTSTEVLQKGYDHVQRSMDSVLTLTSMNRSHKPAHSSSIASDASESSTSTNQSHQSQHSHRHHHHRRRGPFGRRSRTVKTVDAPEPSPSPSPHVSAGNLTIQLPQHDDVSRAAFSDLNIPNSPREVILIEDASHAHHEHDHEHDHDEELKDVPLGKMDENMVLRRFDTISSRYSKHDEEEHGPPVPLKE
ncbi:hypothetical protein HDU97_003789 [Phlyctochytrium planicorne]|nr:hypothetical protein HDU97_003789 [Phlyctochytrium planicorne]